jgi:hypothetical protein
VKIAFIDKFQYDKPKECTIKDIVMNFLFKTLSQTVVAFTMVVLLTSCAQQVMSTTKDSYPPKNPQQITLYTKEQTPITPYRIIGIARVSHYNAFGLARETNTVHSLMKTLAASIGGDGLINIQKGKDQTEGHVIAYQQILI